MTSEQITAISVALLTCAWISDLIRGFVQRKKVNADAGLSDAQATQVIVGSTTVLLKPLQDRIHELQTEVTVLRNALHEATEETAHLRTEVAKSRQQLEASTRENKRVNDENRRLRLIIGGSTA